MCVCVRVAHKYVTGVCVCVCVWVCKCRPPDRKNRFMLAYDEYMYLYTIYVFMKEATAKDFPIHQLGVFIVNFMPQII